MIRHIGTHLRLALIIGIASSLFYQAQAQTVEQDQRMIQLIFEQSLSDDSAYDWLRYLTQNIGGRLSGSVQAEQAVAYTYEQLKSLKLDRVEKQPVMVPKWVRGPKEYAYFETEPGKTTNVPVCALGGSVATPGLGIKAEVIEVKGLSGLAELSDEEVKGKIVFFNEPMDPKLIETFSAYGKAGSQRTSGPAAAARKGAVAVIVRSLNLALDDYPHTGVTQYGDLPKKQWIPAAAISTNAAELLSSVLQLNPKTKFFLKQASENRGEVLSHNVIGEIRGSEFPDEIITIGGHLDSWDLGSGAHDDGAGCVQSMGVLALFKQLGYQPKRTIRAVMFMNEENGLKGGMEYAAQAVKKGEKHVMALESDAGGFTPRGFGFTAQDTQWAQIKSWSSLFEPYLIDSFKRGGGGADIGPLAPHYPKMVLAGLKPDSQRYFVHHHAANDTFEHINKRELDLGTAAMASLIYLFDQYGVQP